MPITTTEAIPLGHNLVTEDVKEQYDEKKTELDHVENPNEPVDPVAAFAAIPRSAYADLPPSKAIRTFRRQFLYGCAGSLGAL
jgi:hypothetical protein